MRKFMLLLSLLMLAGTSQAHDHAAMMAMQNEKTLPGDSLHRLAFPLTDQQGQSFHLAEENGPATLITMFYGDCQIACPIAIENIKRTMAALPVAQRKQVHALMISLNPGVDTAASLAKLGKLHELAPAQVRLAVAANDEQTRQLAASLGIKYRRAANGEINHSTRFLVVNAHGVIVGSSEQLSIEPDPKLLAVIAQTVPWQARALRLFLTPDKASRLCRA